MGFRINTNIAAMNSHRNAVNTNIGLDKSLNSLSSGLRINKAADDASGMTIADSLRSQAQGLGQAINNANDGVAVIQTADGALDEYINIINTVRTKSIQAASDGQNADSRKAIQADIDRLLEAADMIATTTQFNGQQLLDGTFVNKAFHIGAYANETANISIDDTQTTSVGKIKSTLDNSTIGTQMLGTSTNLQKLEDGSFALKDDFLKLDGVDVTATLTEKSPYGILDAKNIASAIADATGITATAETKQIGTAAVTATGTIDGGATNYIKINGYDIGAVTLLANDSNKALASAINALTDQTGVKATTSDSGVITLLAEDGRNISVELGGTGTASGLADTATRVTGATVTALASTATTAQTIAVGELIINGVDMQGTYGDGITTGSAADDLLAAIQAIEGLEASSITAAGQIVVTSNDGTDVNISGSVDTYFVAATQQGIHNDATHGNVTLYSDDPVRAEARNADIIGFKDGSMQTAFGSERLSTIDVTTREAAELSILITDSALKQLDATRADLGSVQNQLESTIRNISVTQVNVTAAESQIRDVDFAKESANFAKLNILAQSGSYAMSQANAVQQNVMRLLQ